MKTLTAKDLLSAKLEIITLEIPGVGKVLIREPSGLERSQYEAYLSTLTEDPNAMEKLRAMCAVGCLVDDDGKRIFKDDQINEVNELMSARVLEEILDKYNAFLLNTDKDIEKAAKK